MVADDPEKPCGDGARQAADEAAFGGDPAFRIPLGIDDARPRAHPHRAEFGISHSLPIADEALDATGAPRRAFRLAARAAKSNGVAAVSAREAPT
jgi:hypothetical protein